MKARMFFLLLSSGALLAIAVAAIRVESVSAKLPYNHDEQVLPSPQRKKKPTATDVPTKTATPVPTDTPTPVVIEKGNPNGNTGQSNPSSAPPTPSVPSIALLGGLLGILIGLLMGVWIGLRLPADVRGGVLNTGGDATDVPAEDMFDKAQDEGAVKVKKADGDLSGRGWEAK